MRSEVLALALAGAALWIAGCDGDAPADAGALDAAVGPDAGVALCARDADCDDGLFCNGEERCAPGEGDARGCVAGDPPCAMACDEEADACTACAPDEADRDGDGEASIACGGADCDDADPLRYGGAIEVCDAFGVDEDCDLSTLHNAGASGGAAGDRDGDGHVDVACANIVGDEERRGDDCDDRDDAIFAGADERCNGVDDDCDGAVDEDFDCVQSTTAVGDNACGHEAERRCSESCAWIDDAFYVAESAATCDYCDDSGMGLGQERPFTDTQDHELCLGEPVGDAERVLSVCLSNGALVFDNLADGAAMAGGLFTPTLDLGYEGLDATVALSLQESTTITSGDVGWGLVVQRRDEPALGAAVDLGVGRVDGVVVLYLPDGTGSGTVSLMRSETGSVPTVLMSASFGLDYDRFSVEVVPDDPGTIDTDETRVTARVPCDRSFPACGLRDGEWYLECVQDPSSALDPLVVLGTAETVPCGLTLTPGEAVRVGIVGGGDGYGMRVRALEETVVRNRRACR